MRCRSSSASRVRRRILSSLAGAALSRRISHFNRQHGLLYFNRAGVMAWPEGAPVTQIVKVNTDQIRGRLFYSISMVAEITGRVLIDGHGTEVICAALSNRERDCLAVVSAAVHKQSIGMIGTPELVVHTALSPAVQP